MKKDRLTEVLGQIDENYILEAAPKGIHTESIKTFDIEKRKKKMNKTRRFFKKPVAVAAAVALCMCLTGVTALAATGNLQGFFADIFGINGAVVGTTYESATGEVTLQVVETGNVLTVEITMVTPDKMPYHEIETMGIKSYQIADMNGEVLLEGTDMDMAEITEGKAFVSISLENLSEGNYKLLVKELSGGKKADQPLVLRGDWECEFSK